MMMGVPTKVSGLAEGLTPSFSSSTTTSSAGRCQFYLWGSNECTFHISCIFGGLQKPLKSLLAKSSTEVLRAKEHLGSEVERLSDLPPLRLSGARVSETGGSSIICCEASRM